MNNFHMSDMRNKRNRFHFGGFLPFHSIANYSSDATKIKLDMKNTFGENLYIDNLHLIPDPLKKNLADSFITGEEKTNTNMTSTEGNIKPNEKRDAPTRAEHRTESYPSLSIVTNFLSGVFSFVSGAMFQRRSDSSDYYECYDQNFDEKAPSLQAWQQAKPEDQNKNGRAHKTTVSTNDSNNANSFNMNSNCGMNTADCEEKLNQVCFLFANQQPTQCQAGLCTANAQVFVEQSPTEDSFEDAFTHEDFECFPDDSYFEYYGPFGNQQPEQLVSDAPRNKTEYMPLTECMEITKTLPDIQNEIETYKEIELNKTREKNSNVVLSCEDKINKLKLLLQDRKKIKTNNDSLKSPDIKESDNCKEQSEPILIPSNTKYESKTGINNKNTTKSPSPHNLCSEGIVKDTKEDFEGALSDSQSSTTSEYLNPCNYFDEVTGRFYSTSAESDDSFQIVFTDNPNLGRGRIPSECESEDSFIVFDETPDSCYSSNDVFGDELNVTGYDFIDTSESETSDSDSESDSGCDYKPTCKLSHTLSRTIGDLTDDSLYIEADEVDCAALFVQETQVQNGQESIQSYDRTCDETKPRGLLIDERRKLEKKKQQCKTVRFSPNPPKVHVMRVWAFAARQARAGHWERHALDRERFKRRIADVEMAVSWVLKPQHRARVMFQRFMPWWNAQKRKELAEKKKDAEVKETPIDKNVGINSEVTETTNDANQVKKELDIDVKTIKTNGLNDIFEVSGTNNECMSHKCHNDVIALDVSKLNCLKLGIHGNNIDVST